MEHFVITNYHSHIQKEKVIDLIEKYYSEYLIKGESFYLCKQDDTYKDKFFIKNVYKLKYSFIKIMFNNFFLILYCIFFIYLLIKSIIPEFNPNGFLVIFISLIIILLLNFSYFKKLFDFKTKLIINTECIEIKNYIHKIIFWEDVIACFIVNMYDYKKLNKDLVIYVKNISHPIEIDVSEYNISYKELSHIISMFYENSKNK
jgi:hypothetical protein